MFLRNKIESLGMSITGLAKAAGVSRQAIYDGMKFGFGREVARKVSAVLGVSPLNLLYPQDGNKK
jgi:predicted transcriptional regulator